MLKFVIFFIIIFTNAFAKIPIYAPDDGGYIYYEIIFANLANRKYFPDILDDREKIKEEIEGYEICMQSETAKEKKDRYCIAGFTEIRFDYENGSGSLCFLASETTQPYDFYYENQSYPIKKGELLGYLKTERGRKCGVLDGLKGKELIEVYNEL